MIDCQLLNAAIGVNVTHVPYRGGGPAMQDIIGGRVDYICTLTGSVVPLVEGKTVKAIAVLTKERAPMLPDVKSSWEQGFKDLEASTWFGFMAPKGTPEAVDRASCTTPPSRRWRTKRCRSRCWRRAPSSCRRSAARPNI